MNVLGDSVSIKCLHVCRLKSAKVTDKRVRVMNEIISGMRLIKMYAWEWAFHEYVKKIRKSVISHDYFIFICVFFRKESRIITQASLIYGFTISIYYTAIGILSFVTFSTYTGLGNSLNPQKVFTTLLLLNFARLFFIYFVVFCLLQSTELSVSLKRIEVIIIVDINIQKFE